HIASCLRRIPAPFPRRRPPRNTTRSMPCRGRFRSASRRRTPRPSSRPRLKPRHLPSLAPSNKFVRSVLALEERDGFLERLGAADFVSHAGDIPEPCLELLGLVTAVKDVEDVPATPVAFARDDGKTH